MAVRSFEFAVSDRTPYLTCEACGLSVRVMAPSVAAEHCPRCIARTGRLVPMVHGDDPDRSLPAGSRRQAPVSATIRT